MQGRAESTIRSRRERTFVLHGVAIERKGGAVDRVPAIIHRELRTLTTLRTYSSTLIQKGRRDWQCQGSGMKRRGGGNRSARRVICIHVRCCLATWQPGHPSLPRTFSLPSPSDSFSRFSSCLRSPPRCPSRRAGLTYVPHRSLSSATHLPARVSTSTLLRAIEIPPGYNKVLLLSRPGSKTKGSMPSTEKKDERCGWVCCQGGWTFLPEAFRNRLCLSLRHQGTTMMRR